MFYYDEFAGLPLDWGNDDDLAARAAADYIPLTAGQLDANGSEATYHRGMEISTSATVTGATPAALKTALQNLRAKVGTRGKLYRQWVDDGSREWVWGRMTALDGKKTAEQRYLAQQVTLKFAIESALWSSAAQTTSNTDLVSTPQSINLTNNGNAPVRNAIITVANPAGNATITKLTFTVAGQSQFIWSGSLPGGGALVIDTGARSVTLNGADDYGGFSLTASHAISEWLRLASGAATTLAVASEPDGGVLPGDVPDLTGYATGLAGAPPTYSSGSITATSVDVQVEFYDQWR